VTPRVDDGAQDRREAARMIAFVACDQDRLRLEERAERTQAVRAQRAATRHEVDDRVRETEPGSNLDRPRDVHELCGDPSLLDQPPREPRIPGRHLPGTELL